MIVNFKSESRARIVAGLSLLILFGLEKLAEYIAAKYLHAPEWVIDLLVIAFVLSIPFTASLLGIGIVYLIFWLSSQSNALNKPTQDN